MDYSEIVLLLARVLVGTIMIYYGWPKIKDLKSNGKDFVKMGFRPGLLWGTIVALTEFAGGLLLIIGFATSLAALLIAIEMAIGAIWKITYAKKPFTDWSYDLLILSLSLIIISFGPGIYYLTF